MTLKPIENSRRVGSKRNAKSVSSIERVQLIARAARRARPGRRPPPASPASARRRRRCWPPTIGASARSSSRRASSPAAMRPSAWRAPASAADLAGAVLDLVQQHVERREPIGQVLKQPQPARERARNGDQPLAHQVHFAHELGDACDRPGPSGGPAHHAFLDQPQVVAQRLERVGVHQRRRRAQFAQGFAGDQAAAHEIAAVDRGDVHRMQGRQRPGVDPVVEMPAVLRHARQRRDRAFEAIDEVGDREIAEVARGDGGQQLQADVGRRGPRHHGFLAIGLVVVRDEPLVVGGDEVVEEPPRLARDAAQPLTAGRIEPHRVAPARLAGPVRDGRAPPPRGRAAGARPAAASDARSARSGQRPAPGPARSRAAATPTTRRCSVGAPNPRPTPIRAGAGGSPASATGFGRWRRPSPTTDGREMSR